LNKADYIFIESTYGDRLHSPVEKRKQRLLEIILEAYENHGKVLIPSFAVERTQEILYDLNELAEKNLMPRIKVYVDTPMGIKVTEVFKRHYSIYNQRIKDLIKSKSRKAITSGGTTEVTDESKFAEILVEQLKSNTDLFLPSLQLYNLIQKPVLANSMTSPRWGPIHNVGDDNGDFIFILKQ